MEEMSRHNTFLEFVTRMVWSDDGAYLAKFTIGDELVLWNIRSNFVRRTSIPYIEWFDVHLAISAENKYIAVGQGNNVYILDENINTVQRLDVEETVAGLSWSPDGSNLAINMNHMSSIVRVYSMDSKKTRVSKSALAFIRIVCRKL